MVTSPTADFRPEYIAERKRMVQADLMTMIAENGQLDVPTLVEYFNKASHLTTITVAYRAWREGYNNALVDALKMAITTGVDVPQTLNPYTPWMQAEFPEIPLEH